MKPIKHKLIDYEYCIEHPKVLAVEWHHIIPHSLGGTRTVPLCNECHCKIHNVERVHAGVLIKEALKRKKELGFILGRPQRVNPTDVLNLEKKGLSQAEIGQKLGCVKSTVCKILAKFKNEKSSIMQSNQVVSIESDVEIAECWTTLLKQS